MLSLVHPPPFLAGIVSLVARAHVSIGEMIATGNEARAGGGFIVVREGRIDVVCALGRYDTYEA